MHKIMYILYSGHGIDGGFGDYAGVDWDSNPVTVNNQTVWFEDFEVANKVVQELNKKSSEKFYSTGFHSAYDGDFPMEYKVQKIEIPDNNAFSEDAIDLVSNKDYNNWISQDYDYDNSELLSDYENFIAKHSLPMNSESYELWMKEIENV